MKKVVWLLAFFVLFFITGCSSSNILPPSATSDKINPTTINKNEKTVFVELYSIYDMYILELRQLIRNAFIKEGWSVIVIEDEQIEIKSETEKSESFDKTSLAKKSKILRSNFAIRYNLKYYWDNDTHLIGTIKMVDLQTGKDCVNIVCVNLPIKDFINALMSEVKKNIIVN